MPLATYDLGPGDTDQVALDWGPKLAAQGRTEADILGAEWAVPEGLTLAHTQRDGAVTAAWITGGELTGVAQQRLLVTCRLRLIHPAGAGEVAWSRSIEIILKEL
ncbi:hypothetical protein [Roseospirillum parvum]|uniref:Uncharacterized protein n=1 Tax=Roseospirillum parvum TaxID=83401 RepID=A0A1G8G0N7_9PROT|nr:hypothetical protein [Roseospirillum parvum]SDH87910.1 hypothetical protein SAMN05421742_1183 [Roseospirillum parvum]